MGTISLKWDPKNLEIRTMSVEKTLEPLVLQVTTLVNTKGPSKKKKGKKITNVSISNFQVVTGFTTIFQFMTYPSLHSFVIFMGKSFSRFVDSLFFSYTKHKKEHPNYLNSLIFVIFCLLFPLFRV